VRNEVFRHEITWYHNAIVRNKKVRNKLFKIKKLGVEEIRGNEKPRDKMQAIPK
jgi:hypothetical protein